MQKWITYAASIEHRTLADVILQSNWDIFLEAKRILRQSVELYLLERLCSQIASGSMIGPIPFDQTKSTPHTLVLVDLRDDIESFLSTFEKLCAGRAKLTWDQQLPALFALLIFSVAKSIMIDAYVQRDGYEDPSPWTGSLPLKMSSAYKYVKTYRFFLFILGAQDRESCEAYFFLKKSPLQPLGSFFGS